METAMLDWLFGVNPWGVSMVIGFPEGGVSAQDPHSSFTHLYDYKIDGGLLDGPVYGSIYRTQQYVQLTEEDEYAVFQSPLAVYHDDVGDYATNEPTMDGTATLMYYLAAQAAEGRKQRAERLFEFDQGGIVRGDRSQKTLALVFTGDEYADGAGYLREILAEHSVKGSFFLTGKCYRNPRFKTDIEKLIKDGHYLGPHSDEHLLYCSWENRDSLLVTKEEFQRDLKNNYRAMEKFGLAKTESEFFLPAYEWYNAQISAWAAEENVQLINYTPGTLSHADYTIPDMGDRYRDSESILRSIYTYEDVNADGLNGFILLSHIGTHPQRTDKFYHRIGELVEFLLGSGYEFKRIDELLF
jgi:peptidoglycan/xylan/chitin deacetylase (PgdA/CDA1 family)